MENANNLEENLQALSNEMLNLDEIKSGVERKGITGMSEWIQKVKIVDDRVMDIWKISDKIGPSNSDARWMLNKMAMDCMKEVQTLIQEGNASPGSLEWLVGSLLRNQLKNYSLNFLEAYTSKFSVGNRIGAGGYGEVFRGQFPGGQQVAVKVLTEKDVDGEVFMAELMTMAKAHHVNLIKLYGFCSEVSKKALVYEYMENGSLDRILYAKNHDVEWGKLFEIAIGTAKAIAYLHDGCEEPIIHHDIKPANVLLDKNMSPKVTDFGLARLMKRGVSHITNSRNRGTFGFSAPEMTTPYEKVTEKCDVYSFGMMLFEILGRRSNTKETIWFPRHVWEVFQAQGISAVLKECKIMDDDKENATLLLKVALHCVQYTARLRPNMNKVVNMLQNQEEVSLPQDPFLPSADSSFLSSKRPGHPYRGFESLPEKRFSDRKDVSMQDQHFRSLSLDEPAKSNPVEVMTHSNTFTSSSGIPKSIRNEPKKHYPKNNDARKSIKLLMSFEEKFSPDDDEPVILYTTTLGGITKTFYECNDIRLILELHKVKVSERDLWIHDPYRQELKKILGRVEIPALFVKGRYIGGAKVVKTMQEEGQLRILFDEENLRE